MKAPEDVQVLLTTRYGSHLYGTSIPTSDLDEKVVYLPVFSDVLLGKKLRTFKTRVDADGNPVSDTAQMPDGGVEVEYVPFQTFCRDFLNGQTYALECAFAHLGTAEPHEWVKELVERFTTCNVSSMAGFAMKQTFDYVHRGVRLEKARKLLDELKMVRSVREATGLTTRLDTTTSFMRGGEVVMTTVLDELAAECDLELGFTVNNGKTMRTLKLNGRDYLETTTLEHLQTAVQKLVDSYGHRTKAAAEAEVDRKSLMHAVRVYGQCIELLETGKLTFPNPEAALLLRVKTELPLEQVKVMLLNLEAQLEELQKTAKLLPTKTPEMEEEFENWLLNQLAVAYALPPGTV